MLKISYHESHMLALAWLPRRGRFDFIVVTLSLAALGPLNVPVVVIRSMRAFRVARIFRRIRVTPQHSLLFVCVCVCVCLRVWVTHPPS